MALDNDNCVLLWLIIAVFMRSRSSSLRRLLDDTFNRTLVNWLSTAPRSFADILDAFEQPRELVRERLSALIQAGLLRASRAEPIDYAQRIETVHTALAAVEVEPIAPQTQSRKRRAVKRKTRAKTATPRARRGA
jgi:hypothetical protein